jgi:hypothetical protein
MVGFRRRVRWIAALVPVFALAEVAAAQLVRCESISGQAQQCTVPAPNGAQLVRQLGGAPCVLGRSWGFRADSIWVQENCRGEFRVTDERDAREVRLRCDSDHNQLQRCAVDNRYGAMLVGADSTGNCVLGETWGWDIGSLWVSKRCTASFAMVPAELGRSVRCDAPGEERVECPADTRGGVSLRAEHRDTHCVFGTNWGLSPAGIWVDPSCSATFLVDGRLHATEYWGEPSRLVCGSPAAERDFCPTDTRRGVTAGVETGSAACVEGVTWGTIAHGLWVSGGCLAEFTLGR